MLIDERFSVNAPIEGLWDSFLNPEFLGPCFPGCEQVETISPNEYDSIVKAKVGPFSVRFKVRTVIEEMLPYQFIQTAGEGKELRNLGQFRQKTTVRFVSLSANETEVSYRSDVAMVGKLATFGDKVLRSKAKEIGASFALAVREKFEGFDQS